MELAEALYTSKIKEINYATNICGIGSSFAVNEEQLTLKDIENPCSEAGISDSKIINIIDATGSVYHLSSADVASLKNAGVSERVIDYMLQTGY